MENLAYTRDPSDPTQTQEKRDLDVTLDASIWRGVAPPPGWLDLDQGSKWDADLRGLSVTPLVRQPQRKRTGSTWCTWPVVLLIGVGVILVATGISLAILYSQGWICSNQVPNVEDVDDLEVESQKMATPFTFEDIFDPDLVPHGFSADFVGSGSKMVYRNDDGTLMEFDPTTEQEVVIMDNSTFLALDTGTYFVSWDLQWVLLAYERQNIWRSSYNAKYKIYERATGKLWNFPNHPALENQTLALCRFADRTTQLGFVHDNDIYYQASPTAVSVRVSTNGDPLYIMNGKANYLYEEDVLGQTEAHYFSTGGRFMLYAEFDDTGVPLMSMPLYGDKTNMYPDIIQYPYPKPGDLRNGNLGPNSQVALHVVDLVDPQGPDWIVAPPTEFAGQDHYYTRVAFRDDDTFLVFWSNRIQNRSIVMFCDASQSTCVKNHDYEVSGGWVDVAPPAVWFVDGDSSYVTVLPEQVGPQDTWLHLAQVTLDPINLGVVTFLSSGAQETRLISGYDSATNYVYYLDTNGDPTERHLFRVGTTGGPPGNRVPECQTCAVGPGCLYVSAEVSTDGKYYIRTCSGPDIPTYTLIGIDDALNRVLEDNADVSARLADKLLPTREFLDIDLGGGFQGKAEVFYPAGYTPGNSSYRYLQDVYAGPNSLDVTKSFPIGGGTSSWLMFMSSSHNVVVTSVDGRGTHSNGQEFKFEMYGKLGTVEIQDQIAGVNYFKSQPYVDPSQNAAIFGWSYGGYAVAHAVASDPDAFPCGISVAPVTHYHYYDTAYTERYMGLANENVAGYNATDIMAKAANFVGKKFMMNHGSADDNVQLQHYMQLSKALIDAGVQFRQGLYVDEAHSISSSSRHLYTAFTNFLLSDCWGQ